MDNLQIPDLPQNGLTLLCGRPQTGKTSLMLGMAAKVSLANQKTLLFSLQGDENTLPRPSPDGVILDAAEQEGSNTLQYILEKTRRLAKEQDIGLIAIDYLQIVDGCNETTLKDCSQLSDELNVPFVVASQLPRSVDARNNRRPELVDFDELGINTDDAKAVLAIYRKDKENSREIAWLKEGA